MGISGLARWPLLKWNTTSLQFYSFVFIYGCLFFAFRITPDTYFTDTHNIHHLFSAHRAILSDCSERYMPTDICFFYLHGEWGRNWTSVAPPKRSVIRHYTTHSKRASQIGLRLFITGTSIFQPYYYVRRPIRTSTDCYSQLNVPKWLVGREGVEPPFHPSKGVSLFQLDDLPDWRSRMELNHRFPVLAEQAPYFILATEPLNRVNFVSWNLQNRVQFRLDCGLLLSEQF